MKYRFPLIMLLLLISSSCDDSTIVSEYNTVKTKKLILVGKDGKDYLILIDENGNLVSQPMNSEE